LSRPARGPSVCGARERLPHFLKLTCDAAVVDGAANPGDGASDNLRADARVELDLPSRRIRQASLERRGAGVGQRLRGDDLRADHFHVVHETAAIRLGQIGQQHEPIAFSEHEQELRQRRRGFRHAGQQLLDDPALAWSRHGGIGQGPLQHLVPVDELDEPGQLALDLLHVHSFGERDVEQRARVTGGGGTAGHRAS